MRHYHLRLDQYGITRWEYDELYAFCRQYPEKKARISALYGLRAVAQDGQPHGSTPGDPTSRAAIDAVTDPLRRDVDVIEQAVRDACGEDVGMQQYLLRNVCFGDTFDQLQLPCRRDAFVRTRRKFYFLLAKKRAYPAE